jgi:hypothetical protein
MRGKASVDRPLLLAVAIAFSLAACSYDWSVAQTPDSGMASDSATRPDVEVGDASEASTADVAMSGDSGGMGPEDTGTSSSDAPPSCATLTQELQQARAAAITCDALANMPCMNSVVDECGCHVAVGGTPTNQTNFQNAVAAFEAAHCSVTTPTNLCPGSCPTPSHVCLAVEGGASYACF